MSDKINNFILKCFRGLTKKSSVDLGGGNCGQVAYAVYKIVLLKFDIHLKIGVITNAEEHEEMTMEETDIYHIFIIHNQKFFDESGLITKQYLLDLAEEQYHDFNPTLFILYVSCWINCYIIHYILAPLPSLSISWHPRARWDAKK